MPTTSAPGRGTEIGFPNRKVGCVSTLTARNGNPGMPGEKNNSLPAGPQSGVMPFPIWNLAPVAGKGCTKIVVVWLSVSSDEYATHWPSGEKRAVGKKLDGYDDRTAANGAAFRSRIENVHSAACDPSMSSKRRMSLFGDHAIGTCTCPWSGFVMRSAVPV